MTSGISLFLLTRYPILYPNNSAKAPKGTTHAWTMHPHKTNKQPLQIVKCKNQAERNRYSCNKARHALDSRQAAEWHCPHCSTWNAMSQCICQSLSASPTVGFWFLQTSAVRATHSAEWTVSQTVEPCCRAGASAELVRQPHHGIGEKSCASLGIHSVASNINYQLILQCPRDAT